MTFYVYMLLCADGSIYVGHTDDLEARIQEHARGIFGGYTATRLPVKLIWHQSLPTRAEALEAEHKIKGWSRAKKFALCRGDWTDVRRLSLRRTPKSS